MNVCPEAFSGLFSWENAGNLPISPFHFHAIYDILTLYVPMQIATLT